MNKTDIDPTQNVKDLAEAARLRQDDLRELNDRRIDAELRCLGTQLSALEKEMQLRADHKEKQMQLRADHHDKLQDVRAEYEEKLRQTESARIDAIRQVDREEVSKTAAAANMAIETLARTNATVADTLRTSTDARMSDLNKRVSDLELRESEGKGKQTVADPMIAQLLSEFREVKTTVTTTGGQAQGSKNTVAYVVMAISLLISLLMAFLAFGRK